MEDTTAMGNLDRRKVIQLTASMGVSLLVPHAGLAAPPSSSVAYQFTNQGVRTDAHTAVPSLIPYWLSELAFTPDDGWVGVSGRGDLMFRDIPTECVDVLRGFLQRAESVNCVAFPRPGGNRWVVLGEQSKFARRIPPACNSYLDQRIEAGDELYCVAFMPSENWVALTSNEFGHSAGIERACVDAITALHDAGQVPHHVAFTRSGGWIVLGRTEHRSSRIDERCRTTVRQIEINSRRVTHVAFRLTRSGGWHVSSNDFNTIRPHLVGTGVGVRAVRQQTTDQLIPALSVAIVRDGSLLTAHSYGRQQRGGDEIVNPNTVFQGASVSKVVTTIGAMVAVRQGLIPSIDTDIGSEIGVSIPRINSLPGGQPDLTLRGLMSHSAGVVMLQGDGTNQRGFDGYPRGLPTPSTLAIIRGSGLANSPQLEFDVARVGTHSYTGQNHVIIQRLIERLSNQPFPLWMMENVLRPLGMNRSAFTLDPNWPDADVAAGHTGGGFVIGRRRNQYPEFGAAGLWSTPSDLAKIAILINNRGTLEDGTAFIQSDDANSMFVVQASDTMNDATSGLFRIRPAAAPFQYFHSGRNAGFRSYLWLRPNAPHSAATPKNALIMMANTDRPINWPAIRDIYIDEFQL